MSQDYYDNIDVIERFFGTIRLEKEGFVEYLIYNKVGKTWHRRNLDGSVFHLRTNTLKGDLLWYQTNGFRITGDASRYLHLVWNTESRTSQTPGRGKTTGFPRKPNYGRRTK